MVPPMFPTSLPMKIPAFFLTLAATSALSPGADPAPAKAEGAKKPLQMKIEMREGMRFEPPRFEAQPGEEIIIDLENLDTTHQPHNFLVVQPGQREAVVQQALGLGEKGPAQDYVPANPGILVHSALLTPEGTGKIRFTLPAEKGVYPYVCTMPGHGMVMYGAIYAGVKMPPLAQDKNLPPQAALRAIVGGGDRPYVQRVFMPSAGPAAIAVALPGAQNFCWDAGECRLRYAWSGPFIDASAYWRGNGNSLAVLPAEPWWSAAKGTFPLQFGTAPGKVKFLGYKLDGGVPEFHYRIGETEVFEKITAAPKDQGLVLRYRIPKAAQPVQFTAAAGPAEWSSSVGKFDAGTLRLTPAQAADFTVTLAQPHHH